MTTPKKQFNIYLEPALILAAKYRALDEQLSLSDLVANSLAVYLQTPVKEELPMNHPAPSPALPDPAALDSIPTNSAVPPLTLQPIVHVQDMSASIRFYEALGGRLLTQSRDSDWAQIALGGAEVGLLAHPPNPQQHEGRVELSFEAHEPLDVLQRRLEAAGVSIVRGAADEAFGAQLQIATPDGLLLKINSLDPATFAHSAPPSAP